MANGRSGAQMYRDATQYERSAKEAARMFELWTKDRESLRRWQLACLILVAFIVVAVAGLAMSELR